MRRTLAGPASTHSTRWSILLRGVRVAVGLAVVVMGAFIVFDELGRHLSDCRSEAARMPLAQHWPPFAVDAMIAVGLVLAGWPRSTPTFGRVPSRRRLGGQTALGVAGIVLGAVLVLFGPLRYRDPCLIETTSALMGWAAGHLIGVLLLAAGVLAAVWPTARPPRTTEPGG